MLLRRIPGRLPPPVTPRPEERELIRSIYRRDACAFLRLVSLIWTGTPAYIICRKARLSAEEWTDQPLAPASPWWHYAGNLVMAAMADFTAGGIGFAILAMLPGLFKARRGSPLVADSSP